MKEGLSRKFKRRIVMCILLIFTLGEILQATEVIAKNEKELNNLGEINHYNAIVFNEHKAHTADVEGALAVGGNLIAPATPNKGYSIAAAAVIPNNCIGSDYYDEGKPSLLLGGEISKVSGGGLLTIEADTVVHKDGADKQDLVNGDANRTAVIKSEAEIKAQFDKFKSQTNLLIDNLKTLEKGEVLPGAETNASYLGISKDKNIDGMLVSKIEGDRAEFKEITLHEEVLNAKNWIIYSDAIEVEFKGGSMLYNGAVIDTGNPKDELLHKVAPRILYVFPNATKVTLTGNGVVGSIIAPKALTDTKGGSVNGQLITNDFNQDGGFECHNFHFNYDDLINLFKGSVEFKKINDKGDALEGIVFELFKKDGTSLGKYTSGKDGVVKVDGLENGEYYFKEIQAPNDYVFDKDKEYHFIAEAGKTVTIANGTIVNNYKKGSLEFTKVDNNGNKLSGVEFELFDESNNSLGTVKSNNEGIVKFENLSPGKYYVKEKSAPEGYEADLEKKYEFTVEPGKVATINGGQVVNDKIVGSVLLEKLDSEDGTKLNGAKFELYRGESPNGELVREYTTENGQIKIENLEPGKYYFKEVVAPEGYEIEGDGIYSFDVKGKDEIKVVAKNKRKINKAGVRLVKSDSETKERLKGVVFDLYKEDKTTLVGTYTTGDNGEIIISDLEEGTYYFKEKTPLPGYIANDKEYKVVIDRNTTGEVKVNVENTKIKLYGVGFKKIDSYDSTGIKGAKFMLYKEVNGSYEGMTEYVSGEEGKVTIKDLEVGKYKIVETEAPEGYKISNKEILFEIKTSDNNDKEIALENFENEKLFKVEVKKVDSKDSNINLEGAEFELYKKIGSEYVKQDGKYTSNKDGLISINDLTAGDYRLKEIKAPEGYKLLENPVDFTIDPSKDNKETIKLENIKNEKKLGALEVLKFDNSDEKPLSGAIFELRNSDGTLIGAETTNSQGIIRFDGLEEGYYTLTEIKAPEGYEAIENSRVIYVEAGQELIVTKEFVGNDKKLYSVMFTKVDSETLNALEGAEFELYKKVGSEYVKQEGSYISGVNGEFKIENLEAGEYRLKEIKAPNGYVDSNTEVDFTISKTEVNTEVINKGKIKNNKAYASLKVIKNDEGDKLLEGAKFKLVDSNNKEYGPLTTDSKGEIVFEGLVVGEYKLIEVEAPVGYENLIDPINITIKAEDLETVVTRNVSNKEKLFNIELKKIDSEGNGLKGAEFELYKKVSDVYEKINGIYTSNQEGKIEISNLKSGEYKLVEIKAPEGFEIDNKETLFTINPEENNTEVLFKGDILNKKKEEPPIPEPEFGALEVIKYEKDTEKILEGAEFKLVGENYSETKVTGTDGKVTFENLKVGNYTLTEIKAPNGYVILEKEIQIAITANDMNTVKVQPVYNDKVVPPVLKGSLKILKVEEGTEKPLKGAEFTLRSPNGEILNGITNKDGVIEFRDLEAGTYTLIETKAPEGYIGLTEPKEIIVNVEEQGQVTVEKVTNKKKLFNAEFYKVDLEDNKNFLEGAEFELYKKEGNEFNKLDGIYVSDANGKVSINNLEHGEYKVKETKAPEGYEAIDLEFNFIIDPNGDNEIVIRLENVENKKKEQPPVTIVKPKFGALEVIKYEEGTEKVLEGAKFKLEKDEYSEVKTTGVDGKVKFEKLPIGEYTLTEIEAPEGYEILEEPMTVMITTRSISKVVIQKVYNKKKEVPPTPEEKFGELEILKIESGTEKALKGAEFELRKINGDLIGTKTTGEDGKVKFTNLEIGRYTLTETKAPEGYISLESCVEISIEEEDMNTVKVVRVENKKEEVPPVEPPVDPEKPEPPVDPEKPEPPVDPEKPEPPVDPEKPEPPVDPEKPEPPVDPEKPEPPVDPEKPEPPVDPEKPEPPVDPEKPEPPVDPEKPEPPVNPNKPNQEIKPEEDKKDEVSKLPETGRNANMISYGVMLMIAGISLIIKGKKI